MIFSESIATLSKALVKAQKELKNPYNSADNPFFRSKYAPLQDILKDVRPILTKNGLTVIQTPVGEGDLIGVKTTLLHESGEYIISEPFLLRTSKADPQGAGSAITYARRYSLNAVLSIAGDDDDDAIEASGNNTVGNSEKGKKQTDLDKTIEKIHKTANSLVEKGVSRTDISSTIKKIATIANYNNIKEIKVANEVLEALSKLSN